MKTVSLPALRGSVVRRHSVRLAAALCAGLLATPALFAQSSTQIDLRGMGYVTGVVARPTSSSLELYTRTDVGGVFRWDTTNKKWIPLFDRDHSDKVYVESLAVDPSTSGTLYAAYGNNLSDSGDSGILKSTDNGVTWATTGLPATVEMGGNAQYRWSGERLQVDPRNKNYLYFGSRQDGLWRSTDGGTSWNAISGVPAGTKGDSDTAPAGVSFVAIDSRTTATASNPTRASTLFVGVQGAGIYRSTDGGGSFSLISGSSGPGSGSTPMRGVVASDGTLYVTAWGTGGGVWRYRSGVWTNITPAKSITWVSRAWVGVAVDPSDANRILIASDAEVPKDVYLSTNGGDSWTGYGSNAAYPRRLTQVWPAWWTSSALNTSCGGLIFDPTGSSTRAFVTSGYGFHALTDLSANPSPINAADYMKGMELLIATRVHSLPASAKNSLLVTCQDMVGFVLKDDQTVPSEPLLKDTGWAIAAGTSASFCQSSPDNMVIVGGQVENKGGLARISNDGGVTWSNLNRPTANTMGGHIAMSSTDPKRMVWIPYNKDWFASSSAPVYTSDGGATWNAVSGLESKNESSNQNTFGSFSIIAPDKVDGLTFYAFYPQNQGLYRSTDGGATFTLMKSKATSHTHMIQLKTPTGKAGEIWLCDSNVGKVYRGTSGGANLAALPNITDVASFGINGATTPATVIAYGVVNNATGLYRSTDLGATWQSINVAGLPMSLVLDIEIDARDANKAYLAFSGRGYYHLSFATSLVKNGGFDTNLDSWSNWASSSVVTGGVSGNALRVGTAAGGVGQNLSGWTSGSTYTLRASGRMSAGGDTVWVGVKGGGGQSFDRSLAFSGTSYETKSLSVTLPAGTSWAQVYVWKNDGSGAHAYLDDISFTKD